MTEPYKAFFGDSADKAQRTPVKESYTKNWEQDWIKGREMNMQAYGTSLSQPYDQSYIVYRAVRSIAENIPQAKYKIIDISTEQLAPIDSPISKLFLNPNPYTSRFEFFESLGTYLNLNGEAFIYINESMGGVAGMGTIPSELWVLNPQLMKHSIDNGELVSWVFNNKMPIPIENMIHIKLFNPNSFTIRGQSPLNPARLELEADYSAGKYNKVFFENNATPDGVIETDKDREVDIKDLRKIKDMWYEKHGGVDNAHKVAFLLGGMTYKNMGMSQKEMDFLAGRQFSRDSILSVFGVHPFVAGFYDSGTVTRATAKEAKRLFWTGTLKPQLIRLEEKLATAFFPKYAPGFTGKFDYSEVEELQEDYADSVTTAKGLFDLGYTRNEVNKRMQLNMPDENDGDTRYLPINLIPQDDSGPIESEEDSKSIEPKPNIEQKASDNKYGKIFIKLQTAMEKVLYSKIKRFLYNQRKQVLKVLNSKKEFDPEFIEILAKLNDIFNDSKGDLVKLVAPVYNETANVAGEMAYDNLGLDKPFIVNEEIIRTRLNLIQGINDTLLESIKNKIQSGDTIDEIADKVKAVYNTTTSKAKVIARTETASLMNGTTFEIYKEEGIGQKQWITTTDGKARPTHEHADNEIRGIGEVFSNGLEYPGDPKGSASETVNCRCTISPIIIDN